MFQSCLRLLFSNTLSVSKMCISRNAAVSGLFPKILDDVPADTVVGSEFRVK